MICGSANPEIAREMSINQFSHYIKHRGSTPYLQTSIKPCFKINISVVDTFNTYSTHFDVRKYGPLTLNGILQKSSNVAVSKS